MDNQPFDQSALISIIVPVYNMQRFLDRCVESMIAQSYRNIEILLIDDGSTDASAALCDAYADQDNRIRVFHKPNGGQGTARNMGLDHARGEYIAFLDADDYWHPEFLSHLYQLINDYNSQIAICEYQYVNEQDQPLKQRKLEKHTSAITTYTAIEAVQIMLYWKQFGVAPWAKLYHRSLWHDIRYAEDRIYEDLATTYLVVAGTKRVVFSTKPYMYYRVRQNSDIHRGFENRKMKTLDTAEDILAYTKAHLPQAQSAAQSRLVATCFFLFLQIPPISKAFRVQRQRCIRRIKAYRFGVMRDKNSRLKTRVGAFLSYFSLPVVRIIYKIIKMNNPQY